MIISAKDYKNMYYLYKFLLLYKEIENGSDDLSFTEMFKHMKLDLAHHRLHFSIFSINRSYLVTSTKLKQGQSIRITSTKLKFGQSYFKSSESSDIITFIYVHQ